MTLKPKARVLNPLLKHTFLMFASLTNVRENWVGREVSGDGVGGKLCGEGNADGSKGWISEEGGRERGRPSARFRYCTV